MPLLRYLFTALFQKETTYRSTTVWLAELQPPGLRQNELFEPFQLREEYSRLYTAVDRLNRRFGSHTVKSGALLTLDEKPEHVRDVRPERYKISLPGESSTRHLNIPRMTI
jgi:hypothetical protein